MWKWPEYFEFTADNLAIPAVVSICLWLLLGKHNKKCDDESKQRLAFSLGPLVLMASIFGLFPSFSDEPSSALASRIMLISSGCAIVAVLGLVANRYSGSQSLGGWILIGIGLSLQIWLLSGMLQLAGWIRPR